MGGQEGSQQKPKNYPQIEHGKQSFCCRSRGLKDIILHYPGKVKMPSSTNQSPAPTAKAPLHGFRLLAEPEPWLKSFLRNFGDLFRHDPPKVWMTTAPGEYWPDALVHRPVAWMRMLQSYLGHAVVLACVYAGNLYWLNQPHVIVEEPPQTTTMLQYPLSEYVPEIKPRTQHNDVPVRQRAQKADPLLSPQRIVTLNVGHSSTQQTIVQADPRLLQQDVPLPNIVAWTATSAPIAPATHRRTIDLPSGAPEIAPPSQPTVQRSMSQLTFPTPPQPQVIAPASPVASNLQNLQIMAMAGPVVVPPAEDMARRDASSLLLPAQAPPQVAGPSTTTVARNNLASLTPVQPDVVPPPPAAIQHNLGALGMAGQGQRPAVVPPAPPIAGMDQAHVHEAGRLLALNAHPMPPSAPVTAPEGSRKGEFASGPEGRAGASGTPAIRKGEGPSSPASHTGSGNGPAGVYVDAPQGKVTANVGGSARLAPPVVMNGSTGSSASADLPNSDRIDNAIFGGRRRYSMHLNMPNLNSAMGSWTVRFAELNANPLEHGDLSAPEAIRKVDPAYPANLMHEQIEGVVVLHAIIRSDGSVDDVQILEGFYQQLDENARAALAQWRFLPGTKNGIPVDVEAVFRVPFRVSKFSF
jgi:TonB family protein